MSEEEPNLIDRPQTYEITFVVEDVGEVETELSLDDIEEMRTSGQYVGLPEDVGIPEANRRIVRTRLSYLLHDHGDVVVRDRAGREWVIPARSLVAAHYRAPWDQPSGPPIDVLEVSPDWAD